MSLVNVTEGFAGVCAETGIAAAAKIAAVRSALTGIREL